MIGLRFFPLKSADVRGAGTRDEPLRTSAWEARLSLHSLTACKASLRGKTRLKRRVKLSKNVCFIVLFEKWIQMGITLDKNLKRTKTYLREELTQPVKIESKVQTNQKSGVQTS